MMRNGSIIYLDFLRALPVVRYPLLDNYAGHGGRVLEGMDNAQ